MEFTFRLIGIGWAEVTIGDDHHRLRMRASYLFDALGDLLGALELLLNGQKEASSSMLDEPGQHLWLFTASDDSVFLRILQLEEWTVIDPQSTGSTVFETTQPLDEVARAIVAGAEAALGVYGPDAYYEEWVYHPFPIARLQRLKDRLGT